MGKINGCLKAVFIGFNGLFSGLAVVLISGLIRSGSALHQMQGVDAPSILWVWVFAVAMLCISVLGSQAARTENKCCLKVFAVFMGIGMVLMLIFGVAFVVLKNKAIESFQSEEVANKIMKNYDTREELKTQQQYLHCCGWTGVRNWGPVVPQSCSCTPHYEPEPDACKLRPEGSTGPTSVYSKSCGEVLVYYIELGFKILLGIFFGFSLIALMGLIISVNMINQINLHDRSAATAFPLTAY